MRSLGGLVLLAGIGVGLFVYLPAPVDRQTSLDNAQRLVATRAAESAPAQPLAAEPKLRTFSPGISLAAIAQRSVPSVTRPDPAGGWQTTTSALLGADSRTLEPTSPEGRNKLITDIQQQLKRVGCYYGRIDGSWGGASKDAMQSFMQRVNATLPSENPDYVLLTLLQSQSGKVCGECPADQVLSTGGRCVARAVVAYGQQAPSVTAPKEVLPWQGDGSATKQAAAKPLFTPLPTSIVSTEPLPGRMAIGGPKALPPVNTVYAPTSSTPSGNAPPGVATAAAVPAERPAVVSAPRPSQSYKRSRGEDGPGTPRYNLMLSLGGAY
jgi:hypothetical protein